MIASIPPLKRLTSVQAQMQRGIAAADSIFQVLDTPRRSMKELMKSKQVRGEIEFRNVSFGYASSEKPVLSNISFTMPAGSVTALVGRSGSGKTTLAGLLPRFYTDYEGHITLDGHELSDYTLDNLRSHVSLVSQQVVLFNDTVAGNIAYGALSGKSPEAIEKAATTPMRWSLSELQDGLETPVGRTASCCPAGSGSA